MTMLPERAPGAKKLGLVIDLDTCVGCHACAVNCKEWNTGGEAGILPDYDKYGPEPDGVWFNRIHSYETDGEGGSRTVNVPRSCLHCEDALCVTVCPTGASYKRVQDGIVLVDTDKCIGCQLCSWACPYGARELDEKAGVMRKCTLCIDRIYDENLRRPSASPPASQPARRGHGTSATSPTPTARSRNSSRSVAASICSRGSAIGRPTSTFRRAARRSRPHR